METIIVSGDLAPLDALDLRERLARATARPRPLVEVDLTHVTRVHVAALAALIHAARAARRGGGELRIEPPLSEAARHDLDLAAWFPPRSLDAGAAR